MISLPTATPGPVIANGTAGGNLATIGGTQVTSDLFATAGGANVQQGTQVLLIVHIPGQAQQTVGYVQRVDQADNYGTAAFYGLGQITPLEIQPLQFSGQLTLTGGRLYTQGWLGALYGSAEEILQSGSLNIAVYNMVTNNFDIVYVGFVAQTQSVSYAANAYTIQTATGLYRTILLNSSVFNSSSYGSYGTQTVSATGVTPSLGPTGIVTVPSLTIPKTTS